MAAFFEVTWPVSSVVQDPAEGRDGVPLRPGDVERDPGEEVRQELVGVPASAGRIGIPPSADLPKRHLCGKAGRKLLRLVTRGRTVALDVVVTRV